MFLFVSLMTMMLVFTACRGDDGETPAGEKVVLTIGLQSDPSSLDPHMATDAAAIRRTENMYNTLLTYTLVYGEVAPSLAHSFEVSEDNLVYTLFLEEGVLFHSGREMTAEDVVFSINRIREEGVRAAHFDQVADIVAVDSHTVELILSEPFAPLLTYLAHPANVIVDREVVEENDGLANVGGGTGPFKLYNWEVGTSLTLDAFDDYWEGRPELDRVVFRTIVDATARATALRNNEIQMIIDVTDIELSVLEDAEGIVVETVTGTFWEYMGMNCERPYLDDVRVRQAIAHAIDRDAINEVVKMGNATVLTTANIPPTHEMYANLNVFPARDVERALQLMEEAGLSDGIELEMIVGSDWQYQVDAGQMISQQLADIGIDVTISALESGIFFDMLGDGDFDLTIVGWTGFVDADEFFFNIFHSEGRFNQQNFVSPELDELLLAGRSTMSSEERFEIYKDVQYILATEAPMAFLYMNNFTVAMQENVQNFVVHPTSASFWLKDVVLD